MFRGEEKLLDKWIEEDSSLFNEIDATVYYMERQIEDYINAMNEDRDPLVTGEEGRKTVELFTAIYRSSRDNMPIKFPLKPEHGSDDFDGRINSNS